MFNAIKIKVYERRFSSFASKLEQIYVIVFYRLSEKLKDAVKTKEDIENEIKTKQEHLENLQPKLNNILQVI
jgi:hypothetical protein